jgi:hypothetical protein
MNQELELIDKMGKNDELIRENFRKLQEIYGNEFIAVENGEILEHDHDMRNLINKLKSMKKDLTLILIQFVPEKGLEILF